jgi:multidrug efflux pump subunit AcrB
MLAKWAIEKSVVTWTLTILLFVAGWIAFQNLSRLEDPEFTIKAAVVTTRYPGASAEEVEQEVTDVIERAAQELGQLLRVESTSSRGLSTVKVLIKDQYDKARLPQVWDELRRKVNDYQSRLPPGAGPSVVNDDFGDVYGIYLVLTGQGYSYAELNETAKLLRRELLQARDVKRIVLWGVWPEAVYVEMSRPKMAALGISQEEIYNRLSAKNLPVDSGKVWLPPEYIPINPTGEFTSEQEFGDLLLTSEGGQQVFLRDVATIRRGYVDPPRNIVRFNGERGIALGISTVEGGNVVVMGEAIDEKVDQLESQIPLGMKLNVMSLQSKSVTESINAFLVNLVEAVLIVLVVLFLFMGVKSGLIIGGGLVLTIFGTFLFMSLYHVTLERISLGALIIALGMLVDNAIVVVEGMKVRIEAGMERVKAATEVVGQSAMPLLGGTAVAITAFAAIGTSNDSTGEYCRSLFTVILISLGLSWVTAVTTTPLVTSLLIKPKPGAGGGEADAYSGAIFRAYKAGLMGAIRFRWITVAVVVGVFIASLIGFGSVKQLFFPDSTRPQFFVEFYFPEGTHIFDTEERMKEVEEYVKGLDGVTDVTTAIGGGDLRFLLTYEPLGASSANASLFASVEDYRLIADLVPKVQADLEDLIPEAVVNVRQFRLGPGEGGRIQVRVSGSDRTRLREMAEEVKSIIRREGGKGVRDEWREQVKVVRPELAEAQARQLGIDRPQLARALQSAFDGTQTSVYREGDELLPIVARSPEFERENVDNIRSLQIWSPVAHRMIPMQQVLTGFETVYEDANIWRRDRRTTVRIHADAAGELPSELLARIKAPIEEALNVDLDAYFGRSFGDDPFANYTASTIPIRFSDLIPLRGLPGYYLSWGGEAEDSAKAQSYLATSFPIFIVIMIVIVIALFNSLREPLIIWLTVPLALIGVTLGLLTFNQPFGFMALLGLMSLTGMLIKNAIVLVDEIRVNLSLGKRQFAAVVDAGVSRMRPVMMAAATTILGMIPLLTDAFFVAMAVTIMVGLLVATVLTLVVVPVLYSIFFQVPYEG